MKKVLILDFDGVLANSIDPMLDYAQQVCTELGYPCFPTRNDLEVLEKMEFSEYGKQLGVPQEMINEFVTRNLRLFNSRKDPLPIIPGMDTVVHQLANYATLAMVTGNSRIVVNKFLRVHGIKDKLQVVLTNEDAGNRLEKILSLKELYANPNSEFYFIGDAVSDIRAAREAGIKSVAVGWGHQSMPKLNREHPDYSVDKPADLISLFAGIQT